MFVKIVLYLHCPGGWALLNSSNGTEWSLNGEQFLQEKLLGSPAFFSMSVGLDDNGGAKLSLKVRQPYTICIVAYNSLYC